MLRSLRARLIVLFIATMVLALFAIGYVITSRSQERQREQTQEAQESHALLIATQVRAFVEGRQQELSLVNDVRGLARQPRDEQETILLELMAVDRDLNKVSLLDTRGMEIIRLERDAIVNPEDLRSRAVSDEFLQPMARQVTYFSPVQMDPVTGSPLMTIAMPLLNLRTGGVDNVLVAEFKFDAIWRLLADDEVREGRQTYIIDLAGRVVAHRNPSVVLSGTRFDPAVQNGFQEGLFGDDVVLASTVLTFGQQRFTVVSELETRIAEREIRDTLVLGLATTLVVGLIAATILVILVTSLTRPLVTLASAARALGAGDFSVRAPEVGGSELVAVAHAFNDMAGELEDVVGTLEQRIAARTADLHLAAQVSSQAATILDPGQLLPQIVELTKENFKLYHAHIYLIDDARQYLMLTAGAGEPGRIMRQRGHRITVTANSLVARAAREKSPVVVDDVLGEANFMPNPLLPNTRSEAAFPLIVRDEVVGVLDVQADTIGRFDSDLQVVLQTLSGQVAVAIANARLFAETERASRHERVLANITGAIQSATSIDEVLQTAVRELGKALSVSQTAVELAMVQAAASPAPNADYNETVMTGAEPTPN